MARHAPRLELLIRHVAGQRGHHMKLATQLKFDGAGRRLPSLPAAGWVHGRSDGDRNNSEAQL